MSWIFTGIVFISTVFALFLGNGSALSAAVVQGAGSGITLALSLAGSLCLWTGVGELMEKIGLTAMLSRLLRPFIHRFFPSARVDPGVADALSGNICANFLGLGNAATPMGIQAVRRMQKYAPPDRASDEMCRLIVLNTASIQLIPSNLAAVRAGLGCATPFDILPAVWISGFCSTAVGLAAALVFGRLCRHD